MTNHKRPEKLYLIHKEIRARSIHDAIRKDKQAHTYLVEERPDEEKKDEAQPGIIAIGFQQFDEQND